MACASENKTRKTVPAVRQHEARTAFAPTHLQPPPRMVPLRGMLPTVHRHFCGTRAQLPGQTGWIAKADPKTPEQPSPPDLNAVDFLPHEVDTMLRKRAQVHDGPFKCVIGIGLIAV